MKDAMFDSKLLSRCLLTVDEVKTFKTDATEVVRYDEHIRYRVKAFIHADGRVLIDDIERMEDVP